ncbi:hypothetical protein GLOIN_2v1765743 [Rhizophagus clarus]|uniref:Endonuclease/exonuclease/phosphatase domain-containing protein n=1 Tax=Rhizophagus clarus TaxID=94130 RepID=A0A8H3QXU8_9GLOM|nr:hypothetical protein GLOIN_2v1765743 [Rhizophagus clarus]
MGHNINGLGPDNFCANKGADIIGICETNRSRKQGKYWNKESSEYTSFWTNKDNKIKGSGVCIIVRKKWEKHIGKINRIGAYYIEAWLLFKNCTLIVGVVYMLPLDMKIQSELTNHIKKELANHSKKNRYYILIGDFNSYMDKALDYSGPSKLSKRPLNIMTWLDNNFFTDTYRKLNPKKRSFTGGIRAEKSSTRIVYDYKNTTNEQWNSYESHLKELLEKQRAFTYIENKHIRDNGRHRLAHMEVRDKRVGEDRIRITTDTQDKILLNSKEKIQTEAINAFSTLFRLCNHKFENLSEHRKEIYESRRDVNLMIYERLDDPLTEHEWLKMLESMNDKLALGISSIGYKLIKKADLAIVPDPQDIRLGLQPGKDKTDLTYQMLMQMRGQNTQQK